MDFFTSDLHIGHDKDFIWKSRGFNSIEEHDTQILLRWNNIVKPEDTVYILGDLYMGNNEFEWDRIYKALNGYKKFICGNHDTTNKIKRYIKEYNIENLGLASLYYYSKKTEFLLSHYPTLVSNFKEEKIHWNLSGHTHSIYRFEYGQYCVYNVAMDAHNCTPISIEQIIKDIKKYKSIMPDPIRGFIDKDI